MIKFNITFMKKYAYIMEYRILEKNGINTNQNQ